MSVSSRPPTGPKSHTSDPSAQPPPEASSAPTAVPARPLIDWANPTAVRDWAADLRTQIDDAVAAGLDATAPPAVRDLGRRTARRAIQEASTAIAQLFAFAGLVDLPPREPSLRDTRPTSRRAVDPRITQRGRSSELRSLHASWDEFRTLENDELRGTLEMLPISASLLAALVDTPYEVVEIEPPSIAVLRAIRASVDSWARMRDGDRSLLVSVAHVDLLMLSRRIDVVIALLRQTLSEDGEVIR